MRKKELAEAKLIEKKLGYMLPPSNGKNKLLLVAFLMRRLLLSHFVKHVLLICARF